MLYFTFISYVISCRLFLDISNYNSSPYNVCLIGLLCCYQLNFCFTKRFFKKSVSPVRELSIKTLTSLFLKNAFIL